MSSTTPEGKVKALVKEALKPYWSYWPVPTGFSKMGVPDVLACINGRLIGIEVKAPGRRGQKDRGCSGMQMIEGQKMMESGALWFVVDSAEELAEVMAKIRSLV